MSNITDGTAEFQAVDARAAAIFDLIYPVGAVFATTGSAPERGTWEEIAQGRTLQGADSSHAAGTTIEAGLPNIEDIINYCASSQALNSPDGFKTKGAFRWGGIRETSNYSGAFGGSSSGYYAYDPQVDLSVASSIYGNSDTVQPPAYVVHFYRRIA